MFSPAVNGFTGRSFEAVMIYYPEEYKVLVGSAADEYDIGVVELKEELEEDYGYLGIDAMSSNAKGVKEIEVCGYPHDKCKNSLFTMWNAVGPLKKSARRFLEYRLPTRAGQSGCPIIKRE